MNERPWRTVPLWAWPMLLILLIAQLGVGHLVCDQADSATELPPAPKTLLFTLAGLGDTSVAARVGTLWLQSFDMQGGRQLGYDNLNYKRLELWLVRLNQLNPQSSYPLLMAVQIYSNVDDPEKQRLMLEFVYQRFCEDPNRHWKWLTQAANIAKHQLGDTELALRFAEALRTKPTSQQVPSWARQMSVFLLEDMGEREAARIILGGLLESGVVRDDNERIFLLEKLASLSDEK